MKSLKINIILLFVLFSIFHGGANTNGDSSAITIEKSYISPLLEIPEILTVTNYDNKTFLNLSLPITSVITPKYIYVDFVAQLLTTTGFISINLEFNLVDQNKSYKISRYDFDPEGQIIIEFNGKELKPGDQLICLIELTSNSYFGRDLEYNLLVKSVDLYFISPPIFDPIIIPEIFSIGDSKLLFNLGDEVIYFTIFVPQNQAFSINVATSELIKAKYLRIDDVDWVNVEENYEFTNNQSFSFVSKDEGIFNSPKIGALAFSTFNDLPLTFNLSTTLITIDTVTFLPSLSNDEKIIVYGINSFLVGIPLVKLTRDRKRKTIIKN